MNWYRKILISSAKSPIRAGDFLKKLKNMGFLIKDKKAGSEIFHPYNENKAILHYHSLNSDLIPSTIKNTLKHLGINYKDLIIEEPLKDPKEQNNFNIIQEDQMPDWKKSKWYHEQKQCQLSPP